ncbi:MAG: FMN-binding glutamate synthase family protein [Desulfobacteraceae bacterium]|nr:FMN-binding glutamate synthase family protein [Desulfobacteraceae bacterium]
MSYSKPNASAATKTKNRVSPSPISGLCVTCLDGCLGLCEVGKSALRGREAMYPQPFGKVTAGSEKDYPIDYSHFNIQGSCVGAKGIEADSDKAIFQAVNISTEVGGADDKIKMKVPFFTGALGSTEIARVNWEGAAIAAAMCGTILVCGENVCGMDPNAEIKNGRVAQSPELARRVKIFKDWYDGYGMLLVQSNVEDTRLGVPEYAVEKLGVEGIEIKWGQGAKDIGGEVKLPSLERALQLKKRGYIVIPNPEDTVIQESSKIGAIKEFERHSRVGMVNEETFLREVERFRSIGAKYVTLKTGAYRPADLARAVKFASQAKIDLLTVDGAGGGTGMSPWRMMNEWGVPPVELHSLLYQYTKKLSDAKKHIPALAVAGGFTFEDQIFKGLAMGAPFVKLVGMARSPIAAAMVGKTIGKTIDEQQIPVYIERFGRTKDEIFVTASELRKELGNEEFEKIPTGALGLYTYYERLAQGLRQLMCGSRKFSLEHISRDD